MEKSKQEFLEQNVISMAITNLEKLKDPNLKPDLFVTSVHQEIIKVCKDVLNEKGNVSSIPYDDIIPKLLESSQVYFLEIMDQAFQYGDYDNYLSQLREQKAIRDIHRLSKEALQEDTTLDELKTKIAKIEDSNYTSKLKKWTFDELCTIPRKSEESLIFERDKYMQYVRPKKHTVNVIGARTGVGKTAYALNLVNDLGEREESLIFERDKYMQYVRPKKHTVNVIGARTGVGKTAYALNLVNDLGERYKVLYFNLEMTNIEIIRRLLALQSKVDINKIENNDLTKEENTRYVDACWRYVNRLNIAIIDGSKSIDSIRRIIAQESRKEHCVVFVDHIGYIKNKGFNSTRESVQHTMIELNNITKDFDCTVFAISQLNRGAEGEQPQLKDLKDSGEVEQTAHSITLLYDETNNRASEVSQYTLICAKNRGRLGTCEVSFHKAKQRFVF